jgi:SPP1 family predicted phage head-tail adaptor
MLSYRLRHRVAIERQVQVQDPNSGGAMITSWETLVVSGKPMVSVPAEVLTGAGREFIAANAQQAETTARINMRWFPGLRETDRVLWDGKVYNIRSISTDITARREYRLICEDGINDGR